MGDRVAKDALYDGFAQVAKALASGRRAESVDVLAQGEQTVDEIAAAHVWGLAALAEAYLGDRSQLQAVSRDELARRLRDGDLVVLDIRPAPEFAAGHIPGARSVPPGELRRQLRSLPDDRQVVAYCRGPYCAYADDAVPELRRRGFEARRLEGGFPEWRRAGLPVMAGPERKAAE